MDEVQTILHNKHYWFTADGRLEVYCHKRATILNRIFKKWSNGKYRFKEGEEAFFNVPSSAIQSTTELIRKLKLKNKRRAATPLPKQG